MIHTAFYRSIVYKKYKQTNSTDAIKTSIFELPDFKYYPVIDDSVITFEILYTPLSLLLYFPLLVDMFVSENKDGQRKLLKGQVFIDNIIGFKISSLLEQYIIIYVNSYFCYWINNIFNFV